MYGRKIIVNWEGWSVTGTRDTSQRPRTVYHPWQNAFETEHTHAHALTLGAPKRLTYAVHQHALREPGIRQTLTGPTGRLPTSGSRLGGNVPGARQCCKALLFLKLGGWYTSWPHRVNAQGLARSEPPHDLMLTRVTIHNRARPLQGTTHLPMHMQVSTCAHAKDNVFA